MGQSLQLGNVAGALLPAGQQPIAAAAGRVAALIAAGAVIP